MITSEQLYQFRTKLNLTQLEIGAILGYSNPASAINIAENRAVSGSMAGKLNICIKWFELSPETFKAWLAQHYIIEGKKLKPSKAIFQFAAITTDYDQIFEFKRWQIGNFDVYRYYQVGERIIHDLETCSKIIR